MCCQDGVAVPLECRAWERAALDRQKASQISKKSTQTTQRESEATHTPANQDEQREGDGAVSHPAPPTHQSSNCCCSHTLPLCAWLLTWSVRVAGEWRPHDLEGALRPSCSDTDPISRPARASDKLRHDDGPNQRAEGEMEWAAADSFACDLIPVVLICAGAAPPPPAARAFLPRSLPALVPNVPIEARRRFERA